MPVPAILTSLVEAYAPPQKPPKLDVEGPKPYDVLRSAYDDAIRDQLDLRDLKLTSRFADYQPTLWSWQRSLQDVAPGEHATSFMRRLANIYGFSTDLFGGDTILLKRVEACNSVEIYSPVPITTRDAHKLVVVTGAASDGGIGAEIARLKAAAGADVIVTSSKSAERAAQVAEKIKVHPGQRVFHGVADVLTQGDQLARNAARLAIEVGKRELVLYLGAYAPRQTMQLAAAHFRMAEIAHKALEGSGVGLRVVFPLSPAYGPNAAVFQGLEYSGGQMAKINAALALQHRGIEAYAIRAPITRTQALILDPLLGRIMGNAKWFKIGIHDAESAARTFLVGESDAIRLGSAALAHVDDGVWNLPEWLPLNRAIKIAAVMQAGKELGIGMGAGLLVSGLLDMTVGRAFEKSGRTFTEWNRLLGTAEHDLGYEIARNLLSSVAVNFLLGYRLKTGLLFVGAVTLVGAGLSTAVRTEWPATPRLGVDAGTSFAASAAHIARGFMRLLG